MNEDDLEIWLPSWLIEKVSVVEKERFFLAYPDFFSLALVAGRKYKKGNDDNFKKRIDAFYRENPHLQAKREKRIGNQDDSLHYPFELSQRLALEIFGFELNARNSRKVKELLELGAKIGLWYYFTDETVKQMTPGGLLILRNCGSFKQTVPYKVKSKCIKSILIARRNTELLELNFLEDSLTLIRAHIEAQNNLEMPSPDQWEETGKALVANNYTSKGEETPYSFDWDDLDPDKPNLARAYVQTRSWLQNKRIPKGTDTKNEEGETVASNRIYTLTNLTPKILRERMTLCGEPIAHLDACALHINIIATQYEEDTGKQAPDFLKGDAHSKIAEKLGITRNEAKTMDLSFFNAHDDIERSGKKTKALRKLFKDLLEKECPHLLWWRTHYINRRLSFADRKTGRKLQSHKMFSRYLNLLEVNVIAQTVRILRAKGIVCDTAHDCIIVPQSKSEEALAAFNEVLLENNLETTAKRDGLKSAKWGVN